MTELEFINTDPRSYGGAGNTNLLISSSVINPGVDNTPTGSLFIQGMTIPFYTSTGINLQPTIKEADEIRFNFTEGVVKAKILDRQKRTGWYFLRIEQVKVDTLPPVTGVVGVGTPAEQSIYTFSNSNFIYIPYIRSSFINSDYNAILNNATQPKTNAVAQIVDRSSDAQNPTNLQAIINFTAPPADVQNCSYTKAGIVNSRYDGTKLNSGSIPGDDPAIGLREFIGSIHPEGSSIETIKNINLADRDVKPIYFNALLSGSFPTRNVQSFPSGSNLLFEEQGNKFVRLVNRKVFSVEKGQVYSTDELGVVTGIS